ncbi:MAG: PAS domain S-box protein [Gemmataceae bacterium]|nr:PAS domain S-box protein [Gemmataceae bacterium]
MVTCDEQPGPPLSGDRPRPPVTPIPGPPEDPYRALFERNPHPMWVIDADTLRFLAVNDAATAKFGYDRDEFLRLGVTDVCPADVVAALAGPAGGSRSDGRPIPWRHRTKAGVVLDGDAVTLRVRFGGRPARLILAADGAARRKAAAALRERDELLRTVIAHIPGGVFWKDRASIYLGCNDQVARDFGLAVPGEVVGRTDYDLAADPAEAEAGRAADRQVIDTGRPVLNREEVRTRPGGEPATLLTSRVPLRGSDGAAGVLGVYLDITDRKQLEEQLRQSAKMEAVGRLAGGIAHDFNNLLTVIRGNAELLRGEIPWEGARMVDEIRQAADRAAGLVRQLLTFSRPHAANPKVVDLNRVVGDLAGIIRRLLGAAVEVEVEAAPHPVPVLADRAQLEQVVMNLAVNARDAMPAGGRLRLSTERVGGSARLSVADTGTGMPDEVKARIFDPFFTTKGPDRGTGLGLSVVHGIVKQAGGAIGVESAPGVGTTFHIDLPLSDRPVAASGVVPTARVTRTPPPAGRSVLLVEDEDGIRTLARLTLETRGYVVTEAADGTAGLAALESGKAFDLVVTDLTMPGVGGREVATRAAADRPGVRVVYMSGYVPDEAVLADPPGAGFLHKPFTPADLARAADDALSGGARNAERGTRSEDTGPVSGLCSPEGGHG